MNAEPTSMSHQYRRWDGTLSRGRWTWLVIVLIGIRLTLKTAKTRMLLITVGLVTLLGCIVLYLLSLMEPLAGTPQAASIMEFIHIFLGVDVSDVSRIGEYREILWRVLFLALIKMEMFWVLLVVARVGPGLIAGDLKHRALPIYFAKPVTPLTYLAGKWLIVAAFIAAVTLIPNLFSLFFGILVTGGLHTWGAELDLAVDIIVSGLTVCLVGGAIVLALSSTTSDHRYVTVAWLAVCLLPAIAQRILNENLPSESTTGWLGCFSLRDNVVVITDWLLSTRAALEATGLPDRAFSRALVRPVQTFYAAVVLAVCALAGLVVSYRRIVTFSRSAANV
ncbi:MAG: hypothetical protein IH897_07860 [Planctomycetes bacterium]|nr:hypothetical protein [Planctomycetota bacterium]